jgi:CIC family chloride channel protein
MIAAPERQDSFPVLDASGELRGIIVDHVLRTAMKEDALSGLVIAADVMLPPTRVGMDDDLHTALERLLDSEIRELPVVADGRVVGLLDEAQITRAYHDYLGRLGEEDIAERFSSVKVLAVAMSENPLAKSKDEEPGEPK